MKNALAKRALENSMREDKSLAPLFTHRTESCRAAKIHLIRGKTISLPSRENLIKKLDCAKESSWYIPLTEVKMKKEDFHQRTKESDS